MKEVSSPFPEERSVFISKDENPHKQALLFPPVYSLTYHIAPQLSTLHQTSHKNTQVCFYGSSFPDDGSHVTQNANTFVCFLPVNLCQLNFQTQPETLRKLRKAFSSPTVASLPVSNASLKNI